MPALFLIVGGDGREYGPVPAEEIRAWIESGRVDASTLVREENVAAWLKLGEVPELAAFLPPMPPAGRPMTVAPDPVPLPSEQEILERDYQLRVLEFIGDGWRFFVRQFGALFGAAAIMTGCFIVLTLVGIIPFAGLLTTPASLVVSGPLIGGLWHLFVRAWRGHRVRPGELFDGFRREFLALFLVYLVMTVLTLLAMLPGLVPAVMGGVIQAKSDEANLVAIALIAAGVLLSLALSIGLWTLWGFALELVMDRGMGFWAAMEFSRKVVCRHFFKNLLLFLACSVLLFLGYLLCGIGIFFALPWVFAIYARAYHELFGPRHGLAP